MSAPLRRLVRTTDAETLAVLCGELLAAGLRVRFHAPGRSMTPTIRDGEEIEVAPLATRAVKSGAIVVYRGPRGLIAHRVLALGDTLRVRGDASPGSGEAVALGDVLGVVVAVCRQGRWRQLDGARGQLTHRLISARRLLGALRRVIVKACRFRSGDRRPDSGD